MIKRCFFGLCGNFLKWIFPLAADVCLLVHIPHPTSWNTKCVVVTWPLKRNRSDLDYFLRAAVLGCGAWLLGASNQRARLNSIKQVVSHSWLQLQDLFCLTTILPNKLKMIRNIHVVSWFLNKYIDNFALFCIYRPFLSLLLDAFQPAQFPRSGSLMPMIIL